MIYFVNFFFLSLLAAVRPRPRSGDFSALYYLTIKFLFFVMLVLFVGLRYNIGVDWNAYVNQIFYLSTGGLPFFLLEDPGYQFLNFIGSELGGGIFTVNTLSSLIFFSGLFVFSSKHSHLFRSLAVSYPYLIIFVAMGYTRQSAAVGCLFFCLSYCFERKFIVSVFFVLLASTFHKSAILGLVFPLFTFGFSFSVLILASFFCIVLLVGFLVSPMGNIYISRYFSSGLSSGGSYLRIGIQFIAAIIFLSNRNFFRNKKSEVYYFCQYSSYVSIVLFTCLFVFSGATFLDRIALYFFPLQIIVFSEIPSMFKFRINGTNLTSVFYIPYGITLLILYLFFGNYIAYWVPYDSILSIGDLF